MWGHKVMSSSCKNFLRALLRMRRWKVEGRDLGGAEGRERSGQRTEQAERRRRPGEAGMLPGASPAPFPPSTARPVISGLSSNVASSERPSGTTLSKVVSLVTHSLLTLFISFQALSHCRVIVSNCVFSSPLAGYQLHQA